MQNEPLNPYFPRMKRVKQITESHCGPAVLEMLCNNLGLSIDQDEFVQIIGIEHKLKEYGMLISEMSRAVAKLDLGVKFWYKENSNLNDIKVLLNEYKLPVGVEWQGIFYQYADDDDGHYSVVTHIDSVNNIIMIADPYDGFAGSDRQFHIREFQDRWWDENEIYDPITGKRSAVLEERMIYIITPEDAKYPEELGMRY